MYKITLGSRNPKPAEPVIVTSHAKQRIEERLGEVADPTRMALEALTLGKTYDEIEDKQLRSRLWVIWKRYGMKYQYRVYNGYIWVFGGRVLVTVYEVGGE